MNSVSDSGAERSRIIEVLIRKSLQYCATQSQMAECQGVN